MKEAAVGDHRGVGVVVHEPGIGDLEVEAHGDLLARQERCDQLVDGVPESPVIERGPMRRQVQPADRHSRRDAEVQRADRL